MKFDTKKAKLLIAERALTYDALSKLADMPVITLAQVVNGKRAPTLKTIGKIAHGLGVSVEAIISDEWEK